MVLRMNTPGAFPSFDMPVGEMAEAFRGEQFQDIDPSQSWSSLGISTAVVRDVLYEEHKVNLLITSGESDIFLYEGVDITHPMAGRRSFLGVMPERGDICICGWAIQESSGLASTRTPIILGWVPPPPWMGHEWLTHQGYAPGEGMDTLRDRSLLLGVHDRTRYKLRHMAPGNVLASSSQGSDLVLDEGVLLANRRGNEIRLRDQDQALVLRSLQQFHAMSGSRVYAGMVQRDARFLPTTMFSDGVWWDGPHQEDDNGPLSQSNLATNGPFGMDYLTPGDIYTRSATGATQSDFEASGGLTHQPFMDPFHFLRWGAYIDSNGNRSDSPSPDIVYGGKVIYRVGLTPSIPADPTGVQNALADPDTSVQDALTEYRIEVTHTSKGILPVTEQTDGFDAERLQYDQTDQNPLVTSTTLPFIEWVLGSVVGNDPYTTYGQLLYGVPLMPVIFGPNGDPSPGMVSGLNHSIGEHAATLLRVRPPVGTGPASFSSFTKSGSYRAYLAGSGDIYASRDIRLRTDGALRLHANALELNIGQGTTGIGLDLSSPSGGVRLYGGGRSTQASAGSEAAPGNQDPNAAPSVSIEGHENVNVQAGSSVTVHAPSIQLQDASTILIHAQAGVSLNSGESIALNTSVYSLTSTGQAVYQFSGPRGSNPLNTPIRKITFSATPLTGWTGGETDSYHMEFGHRIETFRIGNHSTTTNLGNISFTTNAGSVSLQATSNTLQLDSVSGLAGSVSVGNVSFEALAGSSTLRATASVSVTATVGAVTVRGTAGVSLISPGPANGGILCGSDRDPLTGLPYADLGLLPRRQQLGNV